MAMNAVCKRNLFALLISVFWNSVNIYCTSARIVIDCQKHMMIRCNDQVGHSAAYFNDCTAENYRSKVMVVNTFYHI